MITFLTHPPSLLSKTHIKHVLAKMTNRHRGPQGVLESFERGLSLLNVPFQSNPPQGKESNIVHVIAGVDTLRYAITLKKHRKIKTLIAGPNIVINPQDANNILHSPEIDMTISPSQWTKNYFSSVDSYYEKKVAIVPSGTTDTKEIIAPDQKKNDLLIYKKTFPASLLTHIENILNEKHYSYACVTYGSFKRREFHDLLSQSKGMIYLSESESQGLALQEAWIRNVPTLVWNRGYWQNGKNIWHDKKISAPYLSDESGIFFRDENEFITKFEEFMHNLNTFKSREYCLKNLTDEECAKRLLEVIASQGTL